MFKIECDFTTHAIDFVHFDMRIIANQAKPDADGKFSNFAENMVKRPMPTFYIVGFR